MAGGSDHDGQGLNRQGMRGDRTDSFLPVKGRVKPAELESGPHVEARLAQSVPELC